MRIVTHGKRRHPEDDLQKAIVKFLRATGALVAITDAGVLRKHRVANRSSGIPTGFPDVVAALQDGRTLYIECKSPKGKLTASQQVTREWLQGHGHTHILARTMDDVIDAIEEPTDA